MDTQQQIEYELAELELKKRQLELDKRQLAADRKELELKQRLQKVQGHRSSRHRSSRHRSSRTIYLDLTKDDGETRVQQEPIWGNEACIQPASETTPSPSPQTNLEVKDSRAIHANDDRAKSILTVEHANPATEFHDAPTLVDGEHTPEERERATNSPASSTSESGSRANPGLGRHLETSQKSVLPNDSAWKTVLPPDIMPERGPFKLDWKRKNDPLTKQRKGEVEQQERFSKRGHQDSESIQTNPAKRVRVSEGDEEQRPNKVEAGVSSTKLVKKCLTGEPMIDPMTEAEMFSLILNYGYSLARHLPEIQSFSSDQIDQITPLRMEIAGRAAGGGCKSIKDLHEQIYELVDRGVKDCGLAYILKNELAKFTRALPYWWSHFVALPKRGDRDIMAEGIVRNVVSGKFERKIRGSRE